MHLRLLHRARCVSQHFSVPVAHVNLSIHRQAHPQRVVGNLFRIQRNAHRHALHDLDPVAGGILRRQQRKRRARAHAETCNRAFVFNLLAVQVSHQRHRLANPDVAQLDFLEVGIDPDLLEWNDGHQRHACSDALAELHGALGHITVHRRRQRCTLRCKIGLAHFGRSHHHAGVLLDARAVRQRLIAAELFFRSHDAGLCRSQRAFRIGELGLGVAEFLARHGAVAGQRLAPLQVVGSARNLALRPDDVGISQRDLRGKGAIIGVQRAHLAHGLRQRRLGLVKCDFCVERIELHQGLAGFYKIGVVGHDGHDSAADLGRDLNHVALHVGVIGRLVMAGNQIFIGAPTQPSDSDGRSQPGERLLTFRVAFNGLPGGRRRSWSSSNLGVVHDRKTGVVVMRFRELRLQRQSWQRPGPGLGLEPAHSHRRARVSM